jgi:hypothetical protein
VGIKVKKINKEMETQKKKKNPSPPQRLDGRFQSARGRPTDLLVGCQTVV